GVINFTGTSITVGTSIINDTLNITAGTLNVAASRTLTVDGLFNWTAGSSLNGPGTLATSAANVWNINDSIGSGFHVLSALSVENRGLVNYRVLAGNSRELLINNGSRFANLAGASFDIQGDVSVFETSGCDPCRFDNSGLVVKSAGSGVGGLRGNVLMVSNTASGVMRADSGTLEMRNFNINDGTIDTATNASF
ncbi:unnamed protein product, partial [Phaeothamnion confervicola]